MSRVKMAKHQGHSSGDMGTVPSILPPLLVILFILQMLPLISGTEHQAPAARASSPMTWVRYAGNPVFTQGSSGDWDCACVGTKAIVIEAGQYTIWYGGSDEAYHVTKIGCATSTNGLNWTKDSQPVLQPGSAGSWDSRGVAHPAVLKEGATYKMWYAGFDGYSGGIVTNAKVGYATSSDGRLWTKHAGNPVMAGGPTGEWDEAGVIVNTVLKENNLYKMWYSGLNWSHTEIGYATSADGVIWTKYPTNPIFTEGAPGEWDGVDVGHFTVANVSGGYHAWYDGDDGSNWNIGHATSTDGLHWARDPGNPVIPYGGSIWESASTIDPFVLYDGAAFRIWYGSTSDITDPWSYFFHYAETMRPSSPSPIAPADDILTNDSRPEFSWSFRDLDGNNSSSAFQLQLADDSDFSRISYDSGRVRSVASGHIPGMDLADGSYYWRAMAWDLNDIGSNWSSPRRLRLDVTPPANPSGLSSTTHSIAGWSGRTDITVRWTVPAGGDTGSGYEGFSIAWDSSGSTIPDTTVELWGNATTSPSMPEGDSIYFHIRAEDRAGNWNQSAVHLGPFWVDPAPPGNPLELRAIGHSAWNWSNDSVIEMTWSGAEDGLSGMGGYSILWDDWPDSQPPASACLASGVDANLSPPLEDGGSWYFHIRAVDAAGNWNQTAVHSGPYWIDTGSPSSPSGLVSESHAIRTWSNLTVVNMSWSAARDALSGVGGYALVWDTSPGTVPPARLDLGAATLGASSPPLSDGASWYLHLRAADAAGNWEEGAVHSGPYYLDTAPPGEPMNLTSTSHVVGQWSPRNIVDITWSAADGGPSGISGYSYVWDNAPDTLPPEVPDTGGDVLTASSPSFPDGGDWYFHIRARDGAGNWAPGAATSGPYRINTTPVPPPDMAPVIINSTGPDNINIRFSGDLDFSVEAYDPEGKDLAYRWSENGTLLGTGRNLTCRFPPGQHYIELEVSDGLQKATKIYSFTLLPQPSAHVGEGGLLATIPAGYVAAGAVSVVALIGASMLAGAEAVKYRFMLFFLPLFTRLHKEQILDNELRGMIRGFIKADPGIHYNELVRQIKAANGTVAYHLMTLEREGIIKSRRDGVLRRFYPGEMRLLEIPVRLSGVQLLILKTVQRQEGLNQRKVAEALDIPYLTVHRHINKMVRLKVLRLEKAGISTRCFVEGDWQRFDPGENNSKAPAPLTL
jgi:DNA-binding transcriptional ArsR family regulator